MTIGRAVEITPYLVFEDGTFTDLVIWCFYTPPLREVLCVTTWLPY